MVYVASVIPTDDLKTLLDAQWDNQSGNVPKPNFLIANSGTDPIRYDMVQGDWIILAPDSPAESEQPIGTWQFGKHIWRISLTVATKRSRIRLWDMRREIRRICHDQIHSMTNFQRIQYVNFMEFVDAQQLVWMGKIQIELVSHENLETAYP
jgi:hypothetical protein